MQGAIMEISFRDRMRNDVTHHQKAAFDIIRSETGNRQIILQGRIDQNKE